MIEFPFLRDLFFVLAIGAPIAFLCARLHLPTLVGFLITGLVVGEHATGLVDDHHRIELLSEVGIVVLLFTIGVELSLDHLLRMWRTVVLGGGAQVLLTALAATGVSQLLGLETRQSLFIGFVIALSSTAIVLRLLSERAETTTPPGKQAIGILVLQDFAIVPMALLVPALSGSDDGSAEKIALTLVKAAGVVVLSLLVARRVVPRLLRAVIATRSRELFVLTILALVLGTAWATSELGLSLSLGAFLAGLVVSESVYGHHALSTVLPFRDALSAVFFVSVGMLIDIGYIAQNALLVLAVTALVLAGKALLVALVVRFVGRQPLGVSVATGLMLSQVGEFSFLLLHIGNRYPILDPGTSNLLLATTGVSMATAPLMLRLGPALARRVESATTGARAAAPQEAETTDSDVLIIGYGVCGRSVARALSEVGTPTSILELNPRTVEEQARQGVQIHFGDATHETALVHAGVRGARVVVVTLPDAASARSVVTAVRALHPGAHLVVRTRLLAEVDALRKLGAHEVVPEEFEVAIEVSRRTLRSLLVPRANIDALCGAMRREGYSQLREEEKGAEDLDPELMRSFHDVGFETYFVQTGSPLVGRVLSELEEQGGPSVLVLAVRRREETRPDPGGSFVLEAGDTALVLAPAEGLARLAPLFEAAP